MMTESIDSRKFERKPMFDVPLPLRRAPRETLVSPEDYSTEVTASGRNTMAFSLMTKKGNRQHVRPI